jgi:hypothetical protein
MKMPIFLLSFYHIAMKTQNQNKRICIHFNRYNYPKKILLNFDRLKILIVIDCIYSKNNFSQKTNQEILIRLNLEDIMLNYPSKVQLIEYLLCINF